MKPVVVLIGRPNVGKSTLFNRLTRSRNALVSDEPGVTRDRHYGDGVVGDRPYYVVDTGGLIDAHDLGPKRSAELSSQIAEQVRHAVAEADCLVFVVDGRVGLTAQDLVIAETLRKLNKTFVLAINKTEGTPEDVAASDFQRLGLKDVYCVSSAHGHGVAAMMTAILATLPVAEELPHDPGVPRLAVIGRPNAGKSTFVNALLGEARLVVSDVAGTTRDSIVVPLERGSKKYWLIDTAGIRRRAKVESALEKFSVIKSLEAIDNSDVALLIVDAKAGMGEHDVQLAHYVLEHGRALVLVVNKWDLLDSGAHAWFKQELDRLFPYLEFVTVHYISAIKGFNANALFKSVSDAFVSMQTEFPTSHLNRIVEAAVTATPPPRAGQHRPRIKFVHQTGKRPPTVRVHGNLVNKVSDSYRRYLSNAIRKAFHLSGVGVRLEFQVTKNPYEGKPNKKNASHRRRRPVPKPALKSKPKRRRV